MKTMILMQTMLMSGLISLCSLLGCSKSRDSIKDDILSIPKTPYIGKQLRIDGYYYTINKYDNTFDIMFFYKNGVIMDAGGGFKINQSEDYESKFANGSFYERVKGDKTSWGLFSIQIDQMQFEHWYSSSGGPKHAYVRSGKILNDSTFHITESYRMQDGNKTELSAKDEVYHFKKFSPKPDSVNVFVP